MMTMMGGAQELTLPSQLGFWEVSYAYPQDPEPDLGAGGGGRGKDRNGQDERSECIVRRRKTN